MRAAAILGLGCSPRALEPFKNNLTTSWTLGLPTSHEATDAIVLFGGDGTLHRHLSSLAKLQLPVLIVPAGSGNDFARALHLRSVKQALHAWDNYESGRGHVRTIDLGWITERKPDAPIRTHFFCCVAGCGLDAEVARRANLLPRFIRAHGGYAFSLPVAMRAYDAARMTLSVENPEGSFLVRSDKRTLVVAFANAPFYGDGMKIAPHAKLDDGLLDVCRIDDISRAKLIRLFPTVYFGKHLGVPEVEYFQAERLRLDTDRPLDVYADGEFVCQTPVEIGIRHAALQVITP